MPDFTSSTPAAANGAATLTLQPVPTGLEWIVSQTSVESIPARNGSSITIRKNGRYITSTPLSLGAAAASGPPSIMLTSHDVLTLVFAGMTAGDTCIGTLLYTEYVVGTLPGSIQVV